MLGETNDVFWVLTITPENGQLLLKEFDDKDEANIFLTNWKCSFLRPAEYGEWYCGDHKGVIPSEFILNASGAYGGVE